MPRLHRGLTVVAVALAHVLLVASAAVAGGPPYTVTVNGHTSGDHPITIGSSPLLYTVHNSGGDRVFTCSGVSLSGVARAGTGINPVFRVNASTWTSCPFQGQHMTITPNHTVPWDFFGTSAATSGTTDVIDGQVRHVNLHLSLLGGICTYTMTGAPNASFDEASQTFTIDETSGNLTVSGVSFGCFGVIANGDKVDMSYGPAPVSGGPYYLS